MRSVVCVLGALALVGCGKSSADEGSKAQPDPSQIMTNILEKLANGDASVCAEPEVSRIVIQGVALGPVKDAYEKLRSAGGDILIDASSMTGRNRDISEVSCSGSLPGGPVIKYIVRPAAKGDGFVVNWESPNATTQEANLALAVAIDTELKKKGLSAAGTAAKADPDTDALKAAESAESSLHSNPQVQKWMELNEECRGSLDPDDPKTQQACTSRDEVMASLRDQGICFGKQDQYEAEYDFHRCGPDSL